MGEWTIAFPPALAPLAPMDVIIVLTSGRRGRTPGWTATARRWWFSDTDPSAPCPQSISGIDRSDSVATAIDCCVAVDFTERS